MTNEIPPGATVSGKLLNDNIWSHEMGILFEFVRTRRERPRHVCLYNDNRTPEYFDDIQLAPRG